MELKVRNNVVKITSKQITIKSESIIIKGQIKKASKGLPKRY